MSRLVYMRWVFLAGLLAVAGCGCGCDERYEPNRYSMVAGKVVACHPDTGELTIRGTCRAAEGPTEATTYCLITRDSEIYVNDRFSSIDEIQLGDAVELVGRRDSDPRLEHFVVSFAYVDHPLPPPPKPNLLAADHLPSEKRAEHRNQ